MQLTPLGVTIPYTTFFKCWFFVITISAQYEKPYVSFLKLSPENLSVERSHPYELKANLINAVFN